MRQRARALAIAALLLPAAVRAGPSLAARLGWAPPVGDAAAGVLMSQTIRTAMPLQVDALWRRGPLAAGGYASYALGIAACDEDARCTASTVRVGVQGTWTFRLSRRSLAPWLGAGAGYEWTTRRRERAGAAVSWAYRGPEIASLQGGADLPLAGHLAIGPFALVSLGRYSHLEVDTPADRASAEIADKALHAWLEVGLRCTFDP